MMGLGLILHFSVRCFCACSWSRWFTVGEACALALYAFVLLLMVWQGVDYKMAAYYGDTVVCDNDPLTRCYEGGEKPALSASATMCVFVWVLLFHT